MKKWNHYHCPVCKKITIARHDQEGVTPFMIRCRATDSCIGFATSCFFSCSQNNNQTPHVVFFRPSLEKALDFINQQPKEERAWLLDHYQKGGSLMKESK